MYEYDPTACFRCEPIYEPPVVLTKPSFLTRTRRSIRMVGRALPAESWALIAAAVILTGTVATVLWK